MQSVLLCLQPHALGGSCRRLLCFLAWREQALPVALFANCFRSCIAFGLHFTLQVGFRHAQVKGRQLLHNNQPIMIKGAPGKGRARAAACGRPCWLTAAVLRVRNRVLPWLLESAVSATSGM